ncbi:MAG: LysR family transcriptional regulator [Desulfovibrionaceae bacterium]|nr:LysR family transcriptional regulator [Desulfovibrionaceae bacterium]
MDSSLQKYQALILTAECGSFTRAAERLFHSQSAVSRMVADLEAEWGVKLLERRRSGIALTSEGDHLLPYLRRVCEEQRRLRMEVDALNGLEAGLIRIGTFSSVATHWLPGLIRDFQAGHPGIRYELLLGDYGEIERWIHEGRADCGFLRLPAGKGLETVFLERDDFLAVLPAGHRLAALERVPLAALCEEPFLLQESGADTDVSDIFRQQGLRPKVRCTLWDDYAIMSMVESGLGVSLLPRLILKRVPYEVELRELDVPAFRNIGLAVKSREDMPRAVRAFLAHLPGGRPHDE